MLNNSNNSTELPFLVEHSDIGKGAGGWVYHPFTTAHTLCPDPGSDAGASSKAMDRPSTGRR